MSNGRGAVEPFDGQRRIPDDLESPRTKLVYLYLSLRDGAVTADDACEALQIDKGSFLFVTNVLREREYVERRGGRYTIA